MEDLVFQVLVPEEESNIRRAQKITKSGVSGYVLVEMILTDDSWWVMQHTPGVTRFVGSGTKPIPLQDYEVENPQAYGNVGGKAQNRRRGWRIHPG